MASNEASSPAATRALEWLRSLQHTPRDAHEAVALLVHALLLQHGFRDADTTQDATLREDWGQGGYGGRYRHARSALTFEVRATPLGARLRVTGIHDAADDAATLDLRVEEYFTQGDDMNNWTARLTRLDDVATLVLVRVAHVLVPDAAKEGYEAGASSSNTGAAAQPQRPAQPAPAPAPRPVPPGMVEDDPLRIGPIRGGPRAPYMPGMPGMPVAPGGFGSDDLMPQLPGGVPQWAPRGGLMGGNLMGPRNFQPGVGIGGGRGRGLPRGVPPGARYDPMGPGGVGPDNDIERPPDDDPPAGMYW